MYVFVYMYIVLELDPSCEPCLQVYICFLQLQYNLLYLPSCALLIDNYHLLYLPSCALLSDKYDLLYLPSCALLSDNYDLLVPALLHPTV